MIYKFEAPLYLVLAKRKNGKKYHLNLNQYRNWRPVVSNNLKIKYKDTIWKQFKGIKLQPPVIIRFTLHKSSKRRIDRANVLSIHEKFFCDALVEAGCLPDDNDNFILMTTYESGDIIKNDGKVIIEIEEVGKYVKKNTNT